MTDESGCFTQALDPENATIVLIRPNQGKILQRGYEYVVTRRIRESDESEYPSVLRSDLPHLDETDDPGVFNYDAFTFKICDSDALGDANDSGVVDFADVTSVLENFGYSSPQYCLFAGDADRDGDRDFADISMVLTHFNAVTDCDITQQSSVERHADGFTTMDLMQEPTTAASAATAVADALAQMGYNSIQAFTDAIAQMTEEDRNAEVRRLGQLLSGE